MKKRLQWSGTCRSDKSYSSRSWIPWSQHIQIRTVHVDCTSQGWSTTKKYGEPHRTSQQSPAPFLLTLPQISSSNFQLWFIAGYPRVIKRRMPENAPWWIGSINTLKSTCKSSQHRTCTLGSFHVCLLEGNLAKDQHRKCDFDQRRVKPSWSLVGPTIYQQF